MSPSRSSYQTVVTAIIAALFCCTVSIPAAVGWLAPVRAALASLPFISVVSEVGNFTLTQVRYSYLSFFLGLASICLVVNLITSRRLQSSVVLPIPVVALAMFCIVASISAFFFKDLANALKPIILLLISLSLAYATQDEIRGIAKSLVSILVVVGSLNALATVFQFFLITGGSLDLSAIRVVRPDGLFGDSIISAIVSVMAFLAVVLFVNKPAAKLLLALFLCLAGVLSGARTFYYMAAIAGLCLMLFFVKGGGTKLLVGLLSVICIVAFATVFSDAINQVMDVMSSAGGASESGRSMKAQLAIQLFLDNPILGIGTGQYADAETLYYGSLLGTAGIHGTNPHNIYLQVLCENGIVGAIPFAIFLGSTILSQVKKGDLFAFVVFALFLVAGTSLGVLFSMSLSSFVIAITMVAVLSEAGIGGILARKA